MIGFRLPTRVHLESGCLHRLPEVARALGLESLLLVTDPGLRETSAPELAERFLLDTGIRTLIFDAIEPNPRTTTARAAADAVRDEDLQGVVALGGGSALDVGKATAMLARNPLRVEQYEGKNRYSEEPLPFVAIPTTCGTGSEVTWVSVLTNEPTHTKISIKGESMFPDQALVDADLLKSLPASLVAATGADALTHALEATICTEANPISDALAEKVVALVFKYLPRATRDIAGDHEAREAMMRASTLAGLAFGNADVAGVHCLSEALGGRFDVPHGVANAILLSPVLHYHRPAIGTRLADLDKMLHRGEDRDLDADERVDRFLLQLDELLAQLDLPSFASLGVPVDAYPEVAERAVRNGSNRSNPQPMGKTNYLEILEGL